jgi:hypothetical protein
VSALTRVLDLVDSVFVITIEGEHERQEQTAKLLDAHGVRFQFFFESDFRQHSVDHLVTEEIYDPSQKKLYQRPL